VRGGTPHARARLLACSAAGVAEASEGRGGGGRLLVWMDAAVRGQLRAAGHWRSCQEAAR